MYASIAGQRGDTSFSDMFPANVHSEKVSSAFLISLPYEFEHLLHMFITHLYYYTCLHIFHIYLGNCNNW